MQARLAPFVVFEKPLDQEEHTGCVESYARIKTIRSIGKGPDKAFPYRENIQETLKKGPRRNTLLLGPAFIGKRDGLFRYCASLRQKAPFLVIRFGSGGTGLCCFVDALTPPVYSFIQTNLELPEEVTYLRDLILRDRLQIQYSDYLFQKGKRFLVLLCEAYGRSAAALGAKGVVILESIHNADPGAARLIGEVFGKVPYKHNLLFYGTGIDSPGAGETNQEGWGRIFSRTIRFSPEILISPQIPDLPVDLWEMAYALYLLSRYFPARQFPDIFKESGKNPLLISQSVDILSSLGLVDFAEDPRPRMADFAVKTEEILGERKEAIRSMVYARILAWVDSGKLNPCFNLIKVLSDLGAVCSDGLIMDALSRDIINGTYGKIEAALASGEFGVIVEEKRLLPLTYIFYTLKALIHGGEDEIRETFLEPHPESWCSDEYKVRILTNLACYHFGVGDITAALQAVKESMLLSQNHGEKKGLAQAYRLFSLVNLSKQRIRDAIDYFSFALESAEHTGEMDELGISAYYASGTHFLFGNISKAERLALQAEQAASAAGRAGWADRARFLQGRLRFETGRYREALEIFEQLRERSAPFLPESAASADRDRTLAAWIYRSDVFLRRGLPRKPGKMNNDALLFEVEDAYLSGDYQGTINLADVCLSALPPEDFLFIEQPDWRSGFSQCELLLIPRRDLLTRILSTYRALALCRLSRSKAREQAQDSMRRIIREEGRPYTDPNDAFYFYSYYYILQESGSLEVDMNTAISMAFKRLQSRASHIDDMETKRSYLSLNYWNNAMGKAAKQHKLI
jgi:tetratricopeptide (TPR) repeat protein